MIKSIVLPNPRRTYVRDAVNWIFDTYDGDDEDTNKIYVDKGGDIDVEMDQRERESLLLYHISPHHPGVIPHNHHEHTTKDSPIPHICLLFLPLFL